MAGKFKCITSIRRLEQIDKIVGYAKKFLNVDVFFVDDSKINNCSGEYTAPHGQRKASVSISNDLSGLSTILTLLHELGHHIDFLKRGYVHLEEEAYHFYPNTPNTKCPIKYRKHIRRVEDEANKHAYEIATYLDLKIPIFSYLKDVIYQQESLNYTLSHGTTNYKIRRKLWKKSHKRAQELIKFQNPVSLLFATK